MRSAVSRSGAFTRSIPVRACRARPTAANANATTTKKHHLQSKDWVSSPPSTRPRAAPAPPVLPSTAKAWPRDLGSKKLMLISDRFVGARSAANPPWIDRAATSTSTFDASPPTRLAMANPTTPMRNERRTPRRWEILPPKSISAPKGRVYAVTTHVRSTPEIPKAVCIRGRATSTMVSVTISMSWARTAQPSTPPMSGPGDAVPLCIAVVAAGSALGLVPYVMTSPLVFRNGPALNKPGNNDN